MASGYSSLSEALGDAAKGNLDKATWVKLAATPDAVFAAGQLPTDLDLTKATLLLIHVLPAKLRYLLSQHASLDTIQPTFSHICSFFNMADVEQLRLVPEKVVALSNLLFSFGQEKNALGAIIRPLRVISAKLADPRSITAIHPVLFKTCILSNHFKAALGILEIPKIQASQPINVQDVLLYMYYGGMIFTGLKKYKEAIEHFNFALIVPARGPSWIQLEAYKKLVLVSLIATGKSPSLSKTDANRVLQAILAHPTTVPYRELISAFKSSPLVPATVQAAVTAPAAASRFAADGNLGLAKLAAQTVPAHNVRAMPRVYVTRDAADAAKAAHTDDLEPLVMGMVADRTLAAHLHQHPDGTTVLAFHEPEEAYDDDATSHALAARIQAMLQAAAQCREAARAADAVATSITSEARWPSHAVMQAAGLYGGGPDFDDMDMMM